MYFLYFLRLSLFSFICLINSFPPRKFKAFHQGVNLLKQMQLFSLLNLQLILAVTPALGANTFPFPFFPYPFFFLFIFCSSVATQFCWFVNLFQFHWPNLNFI